MMPEAAASFAIEEEDVPPDKLEGSTCKRRDISNRTVKNVMNESNSTESAFDSYNTSLTEDGTFGSYSTNLTDEAFGSYEANLASLNEINKELNLEKTVVNVDNATCLNSNTYRKFGCLKVCKSNQTSFGDLTCSDECYIDHDKSIKFDNRENEEITSFDEIQDEWASFARTDDEVIKRSLERNENNNLLRKGGHIAFNEGVTSLDTNESPVCCNGKNGFLEVKDEMINANSQGDDRKGWPRNNDGSDGNETCSDVINHNDEIGDSTCIGENQADYRYQNDKLLGDNENKNSSEISLNGNETSLENPIDEPPFCCKNTNDLRTCDDTSSIHGSPIFYDIMENPSSAIQIRDVSTETVPNPTYRLRKCTSDPVYKEAAPSGYKSRNSFHKDLNEALSSLLWQPYEYQNVRSTDDEDDGSSSSASSSSSCSSGSSASSSSRRRRDLGSSNNGQEGAEEAGGAVNNLLGPTAAKKRGKSRSRERPLSSRSGLSSAQANSLSVRCAGGARRGRPECDAIFGCEMTETYGGAEGGEGSAGQGSLGNLSRVNIVGLPKEPPHPPRGGGGGALTCAQFKYNANVSSANVVNLGLHQRHHSQIESVQSPPVNHMRSLSVPKKLEGHGEVGEPRRFPINVSNVNVNYYRAVPANVVSSVPQIQCVTSNDCVSNVNIVQAMPVGSNTYNFQNLPNLQQCAVTTFGSSIITQHFPSGNTYNVTSTPIQVQTAPTNASTSTTEVTIHSIPSGNNQQIQIVSRPSEVTRTFTSTEAQTDDTLCPQPAQNPSSSEIQTQTTREQRRRERRERRHHRRSNPSGNVANANPTTNQIPQVQNDRLPDLLNSHLPPSYNNAVTHQNVMGNPLVNANLVSAPLVQTMVPNPIVGSPMVTFPAPVVAGQVPLVQPGPVPVQVAAPSGFRFPFQGTGFRRSRYSEDSPKSCCGLLSMKPGSLRWFIALIAFVAVCCVLVGTVLGAMRTSGRDHLTVSLLMIGVGIVLITVSGIAWKLTSHDSSTCRSMLGLGSTESVDVCARRFVPRLPPSYGRPHHPYAAMMYPEFQYRPPPPSYQASMQEYRLRLLLLDRGHTPQIQAGIQNAVSPPPTYRSHAGSLLRAPLSTRRDAQSEYSCPPSYRSQTSSSRPNNALPPPSVLHSREQSLSLSESNHESINVVLHNAEDDIALDNITLDSLKMEPETELNPLKMLLKGSTSDLDGSKDGNLVTIVQTSDQSPVIVTVSGSSNTDDLNLRPGDLQSEMQILAHL